VKYYLRDLSSMNGELRTYRDEAGSITSDPHSLYPKQMREMWRQWDKKYPTVSLGGETKGLMYAVWPLPEGKWTSATAAAYAEENKALAEVYVILGPQGHWKPTRMAAHPDNPIVFYGHSKAQQNRRTR
jgi:hypothetical protein